MTKQTVDIKDLLHALDTGDLDFYSKLTDEEKKGVSTWLSMRWASAVESDFSVYYLIAVNEMVNCDFSTMKDHPELQWKLLALCGIGKRQRHSFIRPPKGRASNKVEKFVGDLYPEYRDKDIELFLMVNTVDAIVAHAKSLGHSDDEIKDIFGKI